MQRVSFRYQAANDRTAVLDDHFGLNILTHRDSLSASGKYAETVEAVGATVIRYPGGTVTEDYFDLRNGNATSGTSYYSGQSSQLIPLRDFLEYAESTGKSAIIVIPTYRYFNLESGQIDASAEAEIRTFIRDVVSGTYGAADIKGFEVGNEWYQDRFEWTAAQFGELQSKIALWIHQETSGLSDPPDIYVQAGRGDDDQNGIDDNFELSAAFSESERPAVDGVVSHLYVSTSSTNPLILGGSIRQRLDSVDVTWAQAFARPVDHVVTEWNVGENGPNTSTINGLMRTAPLLRLFTTMVDSGVDLATAWTAQAPSPAAMSGPEGSAPTLTPTGLLFMMLARTLPGTQLNDLDSQAFLRDSSGASVGYVYSFVDGDKTIFLMASGVGQDVSISADLSSAISSSSNFYGLRLSAKDGTSGTEYNALAQLNFQNQFALEGPIAGDGRLAFTLKPYEMIQIVVSNNVPTDIFTDPQTAVNDQITGSEQADRISTYLGNDTISGMGGNDHILPGGGLDVVYGGDGNDRIDVVDYFLSVDGGAGKDELNFVNLRAGVSFWGSVGKVEVGGKDFGQTSSIERIVGSSFADRFSLFDNQVEVRGGAGNDAFYLLSGDQKIVFCDDGDDYVLSETSLNEIRGGDGDDRIMVSGNSSTVSGGKGHDVIYVRGLANLLIDGEGDDEFVLTGGLGNTIDLSQGGGDNDVYGFRHGSDSLILTQEQLAGLSLTQISNTDGGAAVIVSTSDFSITFHDLDDLPYFHVRSATALFDDVTF